MQSRQQVSESIAMEKNDKLKQPHEIIREAMKQKRLNFETIAQLIGEPRTDKLSVAVRCTSGVGPRSIEIRKKIAHALNLDPEKVWDPVYLQVRPRGAGGGTRVKPAYAISKKEWAEMAPSARVRALLRMNDMKLHDLAEILGISYRILTNHIYGTTANHEIRLKVAEMFKRDPSEIWDELYTKGEVKASKTLEEVLEEDPNHSVFFGLGDHTKPFKPKK